MRNSRASLFLMELMISILFFSLSSAVCIQLFVKAHTINETTEDKSKATLIAQDLCEYFHYCDGDTIQMLLYLSEYEKNDNSVLVYFNEAGAICTYASAKYEAILTFDKDSSYQMLMLDIHRVNGTDSLYNSYIKKYVPSVL